MNWTQESFICKECGALNHFRPKVIGEGYEGKISYIKFENEIHYRLIAFPNLGQESWIRSHDFIYKASPCFGKFEIELYISKLMRSALLGGGDISEIFYTSLSCEGVQVSYPQIASKLLAEKFQVEKEDSNNIYLSFRYEELM